MSRRLRKAVFPVAGLGTRFLPATKASPKEMLPIVDKPLIQYAAEEAVEAGFEELIFVTGRAKRAIPDHFDKAYELEAELEKAGKEALLQIVRNILPSNVSCIYIRQSEPLGLGHAVLCARPAVNEEDFAVILADDLIDGGGRGCLRQMVDIHARFGSGVIAVQTVPPEDTDKYGIVEVHPHTERVSGITSIVEKPRPEVAPSTLAVVGRYILPAAIMPILAETPRGKGGEIQLTDGIARLLGLEKVLAYEFEGKRYDCGSKQGYLEATVDYALQHPELADDFSAWLRGRAARLGDAGT
jgi:UTP--glucose-1-phosphate uridylyltransferase